MKVDQKEIMKTAAVQLRGLIAKVNKHLEDMEISKLAEDIVKKTIGEEAISKLAELRKKDLEELKIISKAIEFQKTGELNLGSLSQESVDKSSLDPLTACLVEDYMS